MNASITTIFDFALSTRIVFGRGTIDRLGELASGLGGRTVLLVTDAGILRAGHVERAAASLCAAKLDVAIFDKVIENPTSTQVIACVAAARAAGADLLIGIGGGSSIDTAKGCNFVLTGGGRMEDYWGRGKATRPMLPLIAVPTTTGTGSECQSYALISDPITHAKMACGDPKAAPRIALLDPDLAATQPPHVAAATGIDAISHAVESAVSLRRNPISAMLSREAFRLCTSALPHVLAQATGEPGALITGEPGALKTGEPGELSPGWDCTTKRSSTSNASDTRSTQPNDVDPGASASNHPDAIANMQLGAALAGAAIENSMLGAAHAAANPLTRRYGLPHGLAVGRMLPAVVRFNGQDPATETIYDDLIHHAGWSHRSSAEDSPAAQLAAGLQQYNDMANLSRAPERQVGEPDESSPGWHTGNTSASGAWLKTPNAEPLSDDALERLAAEAAGQWTAGFNPSRVTKADFISLYRDALAASEPTAGQRTD